ncbi:type II secretion system F family protein [Candidatus Micrarchaeota archaeon]|nr:type II secretion system F family protein [Candidatus Micrarchaeota archaeon]MBI5176533.1 type II secretion system F family protein [Candidatus Micrarchaeota archaeon]
MEYENKLLSTVASLYPRKALDYVHTMLVQGGMEVISPRAYLGFATLLTLILAMIAFIAGSSFHLEPLQLFGVTFGTLVIAAGLFYFILSNAADSRASQVETVLPDALQLISSNIRAGMTTENAIWSAARPEFGALADEIKRMSADTFGGAQVEQTMMRMARRVRSQMLERAFKLIVEGIHLGGEMSKLLEEVSADIRATQLLQKEITTSTMMYAIFIVFAGVIAAPLLFSISVFYSELNEKIVEKQAKAVGSAQQAGGGPSGGLAGQGIGIAASAGKLKSNPDSINARDIYWFSVACILMTTLFAALILAQIQSGNPLRGMKYAVIFMSVAYGSFTIAHGFLAAAFGSFIK